MDGAEIETVAGLKMYTPDSACCEICTSRKNCTMWSRTPRPVAFSSNCTLYSGGRLEKLNGSAAAGLSFPAAHPRRRFIGCGWDIASAMHPCVDGGTDDMPYKGRHQPFWVANRSTAKIQAPSLPQCTKWGTRLGEAGVGKWVRSPTDLACTYNPAIIPESLIDQGNEYPYPVFPTHAHLNNQPEECWLHDNLRGLASIGLEDSVHKYRLSTWDTSPTSKTPAASVFGSPSKTVDFRYSWQPAGCNLKLLTDTDIRKCLAEHPDVGIDSVVGESLARFIGLYLDVRLAAFRDHPMIQNRSFVRPMSPERQRQQREQRRRTLHINTLSLPHQLWHSSDAEWTKFVMELPPSTDDFRRVYIVGPLYSSQREEHLTDTRRQ